MEFRRRIPSTSPKFSLNFVSNEFPLQRIIPPTKRAIKANGVYIGVGPEIESKSRLRFE
jgi:hypothetical protein